MIYSALGLPSEVGHAIQHKKVMFMAKLRFGVARFSNVVSYRLWLWL
jgi:Zn-dependent membrane protease YugP